MKKLFKLSAGAGLVTMLLGALMVLAPMGAGASHVEPVRNPGGDDNKTCSEAAYDVEAYVNEVTSPTSGTASGSVTIDGETYVLEVGWILHDDGTISFDVTDDSDLLVSAVAIKQGDSNSGGGTNFYTYSPPVDSDAGLVDPKGDGQFSHMSFCGDVPETGSLSVDKDVAGNDPQDADLAFPFSVDCGDVDLDAEDEAFTLTASQTHTIDGLPVGTSCTVTETDAKGADSTTYKIGSADAQSGTTASGATIAKDATTAVLFTNTFNEDAPETGSLSVDKDVAGNDPQDADLAFPFSVDCGDVDLDAEDEAFTLTASQTHTIDGLPVGTSCTVTETDAKGADSTTYKIGSADAQSGTVASGATIAKDATTAVLFTNTFNRSFIPPVVIDEEVERASLTVVKEVAGPLSALPDTWSFNFDLDGAGVENTSLDNEDPSVTTAGLAPGEYSIDELGTDSTTVALTDIICVEDNDAADSDFVVSDDDLRDGVAVTLDEGSDVTCTFVNTYSAVDVLPGPPVTPPVVTPPVVTPPVVTPPVVTPPAVVPVAQPTPQVLGVQTVRALPRTGNESGGLASVGALMLAFGAAMVLGSKRLARR